MSQPHKHIKKKSVSPVLIGIIILAVLGLSGGWYFLREPPQTPAPKPLKQSQEFPPVTPEIKAEADTGPTQPSVPAPPADSLIATSPCEQTEKEISTFFNALDGAEYIHARQLKDGSQKYFNLLIDKLLAKPPVVAGERESLTSILHNTAHFYRVLGKNDLFLIKGILEQEGDSMESTLALFYRWSELAPKCDTAKDMTHLPLAGLYEYAGFFLNTLGGQAYLFRRDSRIRMLGKYYSILVLDRANDASLNRYGIDIRPSVDSLLEEMKNTTSLTGRDTYLARLILLRDKYLARYGAKTATSAKKK